MKFYLFSFLLIFSVFSCKEEVDLCENVVCNNDGICNEGNCDCPPEFTGTNCDELARASAIKISKVYVTEYLEDNDNNEQPWDESDNPDIYIEVSSSVLSTPLRTETIQNAENNTEHEFNVDWRLEDTGVGNQNFLLEFQLFDDDEFSEEFMGNHSFIVSNFREEKPTTIDFPYTPGYNIGYRVELEWIFE